MHRKIMKVQTGRADSESSDEELPQYMFPESDMPMQNMGINEEKKQYEKE